MLETIATISNVVLFIGVWLNARANRFGFVLWFFGNSGLLIAHAIGGLRADMFRDCVFVVFAAYGYFSWEKKGL